MHHHISSSLLPFDGAAITHEALYRSMRDGCFRHAFQAERRSASASRVYLLAHTAPPVDPRSMLLVRHGILETDLLSAASDVLFTLRLSVGTTHPLLGAISGINRILHHSDLVPDGQLRLDLVASLRGGEFPAPEPSLSDLASSCEAVA